MLTIIRCENDFVEDDLLDEARDILNQFQNLNLIFDNFKDPSFNDKGNANIVFRMSINSSSNHDSLDYLRRLENALTNLINHGKLYIRYKERINKKFNNRMISSNPNDFSSAISEILVADNLLSLFGPDKFQYEEGKKSESKPDFRITSMGNIYNLELKTLMKGTTKEKIETIFTEVCMGVLSELKDKAKLKCHILIRLDTAKLCIDEEKHIDTEASKKYLLSYFDKLALLNAVGNNVTINFGDIRGINFQEEDLERRASEIFRNESHPAIIKTSEQKDDRTDNHIVEWLDKIKIKDLVQCPFDTLIVKRNVEASCVSISPIDINMEDEHSNIPGFLSSTMSKNSYIHQIQDALKRKDELRQRKKNQPAVIVLDTFDWYFNYFDYDEFAKLKRLLEEELKKHTDISGVILFHDIYFGSRYNEFYDGRYIENKYCNPSIRVTKEELQSLHIIKKHHDVPQIGEELFISKTDTPEIQISKINTLIKIQPGLRLEIDKKNLLQIIYQFLGRSCIDRDILKNLNDITTEYCFDPDPVGTELGLSPGYDWNSVGFSYTTVRGLAASCLYKLLPRYNTKENLILATKMSEDKHTLVREAVCETFFC